MDGETHIVSFGLRLWFAGLVSRLRSVVFAPDAINLGSTDDGEKADEVRPDFVEDEDDDQGEDGRMAFS
jgi:hypothetical protein